MEQLFRGEYGARGFRERGQGTREFRQGNEAGRAGGFGDNTVAEFANRRFVFPERVPGQGLL